MKLFFDDEFDAITTAIGASGKDFKTVAGHIFPDMKPESAYARLKACCSPTGDQRLTFGQVIRLMQFTGMYDPLYYACDETMHAHPERKAPKDDEVRLLEVIASASDTLGRALEAVDRLKRGTTGRQA